MTDFERQYVHLKCKYNEVRHNIDEYDILSIILKQIPFNDRRAMELIGNNLSEFRSTDGQRYDLDKPLEPQIEELKQKAWQTLDELEDKLDWFNNDLIYRFEALKGIGDQHGYYLDFITTPPEYGVMSTGTRTFNKDNMSYDKVFYTYVKEQFWKDSFNFNDFKLSDFVRLLKLDGLNMYSKEYLDPKQRAQVLNKLDSLKNKVDFLTGKRDFMEILQDEHVLVNPQDSKDPLMYNARFSVNKQNEPEVEYIDAYDAISSIFNPFKQTLKQDVIDRKNEIKDLLNTIKECEENGDDEQLMTLANCVMKDTSNKAYTTIDEIQTQLINKWKYNTPKTPLYDLFTPNLRNPQQIAKYQELYQLTFYDEEYKFKMNSWIRDELKHPETFTAIDLFDQLGFLKVKLANTIFRRDEQGLYNIPSYKDLYNDTIQYLDTLEQIEREIDGYQLNMSNKVVNLNK